MKFTARTHPGRVRPLNEDSYFVPDTESVRLFLVADGMGGHLAGEVASQLASSSLYAYITEHASRVDELTMRAGFDLANTMIYDQARSISSQRGMGTTMSALWMDRDYAIIGHVGDSRIYLQRQQKLQMLTRDHSFVHELLEMGEITKEEARNHPHRNIITRALGTSAHERVDTYRVAIEPGDILLFCTDGLTSYYDEPELAEKLGHIACGRASMDAIADEFVRGALDRGGHDNITLIIACVPDKGGDSA